MAVFGVGGMGQMTFLCAVARYFDSHVAGLPHGHSREQSHGAGTPHRDATECGARRSHRIARDVFADGCCVFIATFNQGLDPLYHPARDNVRMMVATTCEGGTWTPSVRFVPP
jgi:hypothetical protein